MPLIDQAVAHHTRGEIAQAEALYRKILRQTPAHFDALQLLGVICHQSGKHAEAVDLMQRALRANPSQAAVYSNLGLALQALGRYDDALASYDKCLRLDPKHAAALSNRGNVLKTLGRMEEALENYERALSVNPNSPAALNNRATMLRLLDRHSEALADCDLALELAPGYADALCNRGSVLQDLLRYREALESYAAALRVDPGHADAHWNDGLCRLMLGDYAKGWPKYEWRWKTAQRGTEREFSQPLWLGKESLRDRAILLHSEQGLGDTLQFCRYARHVSALGATVVLEVQAPLKALLSRLEGVAGVVARGEPLPPFDFQCPLPSLPLALASSLRGIPADRGYLRSDPEAVRRWSARLGPKRKPRVGIVWRGGHVNPRRSVPIAMIGRLVTDRVDFFCLQKDVNDAERLALGASPGIAVIADEIGDFSDTAAVVELMDLVISIDTSIAHLAGGMGANLWVMLPRNPDWRWMADRSDSPWYPGATLFRSTDYGDWSGVVARIATRLAQEFR